MRTYLVVRSRCRNDLSYTTNLYIPMLFDSPSITSSITMYIILSIIVTRGIRSAEHERGNLNLQSVIAPSTVVSIIYQYNKSLILINIIKILPISCQCCHLKFCCCRSTKSVQCHLYSTMQ